MAALPGRVDPNEIGLDADRLGRLDRHLRAYVDDGRLPNTVVAVMRDGKLGHLSTYGLADVENSVPVADDTIFRIASMTKPITTVAAMMLWEEGLFELHDPVSRFIPSFADAKVFRAGSLTKFSLDPITEPMEIWHLMTHTAGLTYGFMYAHVVDEMYRRAGFEWGVPSGTSLAEACDRWATLPLLFQPGAEWAYSVATDVLGRVVEVASGRPLDEFLRERIFEPLGMDDTGFFVPESSLHRLAAAYAAHPGTLKATRMDAASKGPATKPSFLSGGGGLVSTVADYLAFQEMLRHGGQRNGVRLLSPRTVTYMTSNHIPGGRDLTEFGRPLFSETAYDGVGFGLGFSVTLDPVKAKVPGSVGDFGWGGAHSTFFNIDPVEDLSIVFMTQLLPSSTHPIRSQVKQLVHQAIVA
jgi:CubicO group peptidase (beta-lactamase class C family)